MTQGPFDLAIDLGMQVDGLQQIEPTLRAAALTVVGRATVACRSARPGAAAARSCPRARAVGERRGARSRTCSPGSPIPSARKGRMDEARGHAEQALALLGALGQADGKRSTSSALCSARPARCRRRSQPTSARFAIDRELGDGYAEAKVLNSLAIFHAEQGRFDEARAHLESALSISRELGDRRQEGLVLGNLGSLNIEQGRHGLGREQSEAALAIHRDTGERIEEGQTLANIACSTRRPVVSTPREEISSPRWRSRAMRAAASVRVSSWVTWALWRARTDSSTRRACTTTRRSPSIAPSAIVAAKAGCSHSWLTCSHDRVGTTKRVPWWRRPKRICAPLAKRSIWPRLLCLRGRLELAAGEPGARPAIARGGEHRCRSLDLDPGAKLWTKIAGLREAIGAGTIYCSMTFAPTDGIPSCPTHERETIGCALEVLAKRSTTPRAS
jgi:hypothetical protein